MAWIGTMLPHGASDGMVKKMTGIDVLEKKVEEARRLREEAR